jgi:YbgC/YbaW family acyl-CoA thioester hydrolase
MPIGDWRLALGIGVLTRSTPQSAIRNPQSNGPPADAGGSDMQKYTIEERVRWGDVDAASIIFYGAYIRFFEFAETELFRSVGLPYSVMFDELDVWLPRVHLECDFHHAAQLDDLLEVSVYVGRFGNTSMRLDFEVRRKGDELIIAQAHFVLAAVRRDTFETVPIPQELRNRLAPYAK